MSTLALILTRHSNYLEGVGVGGWGEWEHAHTHTHIHRRTCRVPDGPCPGLQNRYRSPMMDHFGLPGGGELLCRSVRWHFQLHSTMPPRQSDPMRLSPLSMCTKPMQFRQQSARSILPIDANAVCSFSRSTSVPYVARLPEFIFPRPSGRHIRSKIKEIFHNEERTKARKDWFLFLCTRR